MVWRNIIVETIVAALLTGIFGVIVVLITNVFTNRKGYDKIDSKIGNVDHTTLSGQHKDIMDIQNTEFNRIYSKVDNIDKEIYSNKEKYKNLNLDQREIKNSVDKLLFEWQTLVIQNKDLEKEVSILRNQNFDLIQKNSEIHKDNQKLSKQLELTRELLGSKNKSNEMHREQKSKDDRDFER